MAIPLKINNKTDENAAIINTANAKILIFFLKGIASFRLRKPKSTKPKGKAIKNRAY